MEVQSEIRRKGFFQTSHSTAPTTQISSNIDPDPSSASQGSKGFFKTGAKEETGGNALLGLLVYSFMILFVPIFIYFGMKQVLEDSGYETPTTTIAPAILAIASVNVVIVLYVIKAFREESRGSDTEDRRKTE